MVGNFSRLEAQADTCSCIEGAVGVSSSAPVLVVALERKTLVSVCGQVLDTLGEGEFLVTEFSVFDCATGAALAAYDGSTVHSVKGTNRKLEITEVKYLPAGTDWEWMFVPVGIRYMTGAKGRITVSEPQPHYKGIDIDRSNIETFLFEIVTLNRAGHLGGREPEEIIGKLEILALNGNRLATDILMDFEQFFNFSTDGAVASQLKDAVATVEWSGK